MSYWANLLNHYNLFDLFKGATLLAQSEDYFFNFRAYRKYLFCPGSRSERGGARRAPTTRVLFRFVIGTEIALARISTPLAQEFKFY